jgi:hypothetical protein
VANNFGSGPIILVKFLHGMAQNDHIGNHFIDLFSELVVAINQFLIAFNEFEVFIDGLCQGCF